MGKRYINRSNSVVPIVTDSCIYSYRLLTEYHLVRAHQVPGMVFNAIHNAPFPKRNNPPKRFLLLPVYSWGNQLREINQHLSNQEANKEAGSNLSLSLCPTHSPTMPCSTHRRSSPPLSSPSFNHWVLSMHHYCDKLQWGYFLMKPQVNWQ